MRFIRRITRTSKGRYYPGWNAGKRLFVFLYGDEENRVLPGAGRNKISDGKGDRREEKQRKRKREFMEKQGKAMCASKGIKPGGLAGRAL